MGHPNFLDIPKPPYFPPILPQSPDCQADTWPEQIWTVNVTQRLGHVSGPGGAIALLPWATNYQQFAAGPMLLVGSHPFLTLRPSDTAVLAELATSALERGPSFFLIRRVRPARIHARKVAL